MYPEVRSPSGGTLPLIPQQHWQIARRDDAGQDVVTSKFFLAADACPCGVFVPPAALSVRAASSAGRFKFFICGLAFDLHFEGICQILPACPAMPRPHRESQVPRLG